MKLLFVCSFYAAPAILCPLLRWFCKALCNFLLKVIHKVYYCYCCYHYLSFNGSYTIWVGIMSSNVHKCEVHSTWKEILRRFHSRDHWRLSTPTPFVRTGVNSYSIHMPDLLTRMGWTPRGRQKIPSPLRWPPSSPRFWLGSAPLSSGSWRSSPGRGSACSHTPPVVLSAALQSIKGR